MRRIAIIDLGTNTFNLLIVSSVGGGAYQIVYSGKLAAKLGEGGINKKLITPQAFQRGLKVVGDHVQTIRSHGVNEVYAFATSAIRNANNGLQFVDEIKRLYGFEVKIIDGPKEAEFIYHGVRQAVELNDEYVLILDIGGGSNEIIIGNSKSYVWKRSFDLGVSRLIQRFNPSDPLSIDQLNEIENYLEQELTELSDPIELYKPTTIVGSSGSFDTYRSILTAQGIINPNGEPRAEIPMYEYLGLHERLIRSTIDQRNAMPGMDPMRVEMIVLATIFTYFVIKKYGFTRMIQSSFALKEGAIWSVLNANQNRMIWE